MRIDIYTVNGSPSGVTPHEIEWPGVGGAELHLLRWAENMGKRGHIIRIYNDPRLPYNQGGVSFRNRREYIPQDERDILITFRGYNPIVENSRYRLHIGWTVDQYTNLEYPYDKYWYPSVWKMVGISDFNRRDHIKRYGITSDRFEVIDIGSDVSEYSGQIKKTPLSFIFSSVPHRGLAQMFRLWPTIKRNFPGATLTVTSDYGLWNGGADAGNSEFKQMARGLEGVKFVGRVPREELIEIQKKTQFHVYPCIYDENFCISIAESQMAGTICVTPAIGALETTNFTGYVLYNHEPDTEKFNDAVMNIISEHAFGTNYEMLENASRIQQNAFNRFGWDSICQEWENLFERGLNEKRFTR